MKPSTRQGGATSTKSRIEQAETRTEQAEMTLQRVARRETVLPQMTSPRRVKKLPSPGTAAQKPRDQLTDRQRKILELIAESSTNKEMAVELGPARGPSKNTARL